MPSNSLIKWNQVRAPALDEFEAAHAKVGGSERGRRYATQQLNRAYAVLLSSEFQGFVRDLYSECVDQLVAPVPIHLRALSRTQYIWLLKIDRGNPQADAIGSDFRRLALPFWDAVYSISHRHRRRRVLLDELMKWRNAIAHNDFDPAVYGPVPVLHLRRVRVWRTALNGLCRGFDRVLFNYLKHILGISPWPP